MRGSDGPRPRRSARARGPGWEGLAARTSRRLTTTLRQARLEIRNRLTRAPVTGTADVVVSMTSYGRRTAAVHLALESIGRGTVRPRRLQLWLTEDELASGLPAPLRRLRARGLEILPTADLGPHKKYYPYVAAQERHTAPLVTADDDALYPRYWLERLLTAYGSRPDEVSCFRANVMDFSGDVPRPYAQWQACTSTEASLAHLMTGVGGVLYPPELLVDLRTLGTGFLDVAPSADDLWLHHAALRRGMRVRQVVGRRLDFPPVLRSQRSTLTRENVAGGQNDRIVARLYSPSDLALIRADSRDG